MKRRITLDDFSKYCDVYQGLDDIQSQISPLVTEQPRRREDAPPPHSLGGIAHETPPAPPVVNIPAGWGKRQSRRPHEPETAGSSPAPATIPSHHAPVAQLQGTPPEGEDPDTQPGGGAIPSPSLGMGSGPGRLRGEVLVGGTQRLGQASRARKPDRWEPSSTWTWRDSRERPVGEDGWPRWSR